jgi:hypothetical protein
MRANAQNATIAERAVPFYVRLLIPSVATDAYALRGYLVTNDLSDSASARESMDEIYDDALELTHGSVTDALFVSLLGSLEHESIPLDVFGRTIAIPLSTESHAAFKERVSHLPRHIYGIAEDDRDKLQHFFASAWVKRATGMTWLAALAGNLVEAGEKLFSIEGSLDPRDVHANHDGIHFGAVAAGSLQLSPSAFLTPNP